MPITNTTRIIDLPTKSSLGSGDYFAVDNANGDTSKILATSVSGSSTAGLVAKEYSNAQTYDKGDYSIHVENNVPTLYRANQNIPTAETWNAAHWDQTDAGSELTTANADIASLNSNLPKKDTVSGTTDSSGYVTTSISTSSRIILAAWIDGAPNNRVVTPFTNNSIYTMLVTNAQFVAATGQNVTIKYVYVDA